MSKRLKRVPKRMLEWLFLGEQQIVEYIESLVCYKAEN